MAGPPPVPRGRQEDHRKTHFDKAYDFSGAMPGKEAGSADDASWVPGGCHMQCGRGRDGNLQKLAWGARKGRRLLFCQGKPLPRPFGHTKVKLESGPGERRPSRQQQEVQRSLLWTLRGCDRGSFGVPSGEVLGERSLGVQGREDMREGAADLRAAGP